MKSGINLEQIDRSVRPQDDLYTFTNGGWLRSTEIPADKPGTGAFTQLADQVEERTRAILEDAAREEGPDREEEWRKLGDSYRAFMDVQRIEAVGTEPLTVPLQSVAEVENAEQLVRLMGALGREGVRGLVFVSAEPDDKNPGVNVLQVYQDGLSLPDESYYREDQYADKREAFVGHVDRLLGLAGCHEARAGERVLALETRVAKEHWDRVTCRDAVKRYTPLTFAELKEHTGDFPWEAYFEGLRAEPHVYERVIAQQIGFVDALPTLLNEIALEDWKVWLAYRVVARWAPLLNEALVTEAWDFYSHTLSGAPEQRDRWKRGIDHVSRILGEALGKVYVGRHFDQAQKDRMLELVANVQEAFRRSFQESDWMTEETKAKALAKMETFNPKIGFPDEWQDYSTLEVSPDDLVGNARRSAEWERDRDLAKVGQPVDRGEWFMNVYTVNAYYNPPMNEIVFPAAILLPPFFDMDADDAVNYGGIGAVIGHEIGHGFDDQGSLYDETGKLEDWWTDEDRVAFKKRSDALIEQFNELSPVDVPDKKVNGALTVGENIGDLGGLAIGYKAYRIACEAKGEMPEIDGFTGPQRFFLGWANVWKRLYRPDFAQMLLSVDPHSPGDLRANAVRNIDGFYEAFDVKEGDALYLPQDQRITIF